MDIKLVECFKQIPVLQNLNPEEFWVEKLSGFSNLNYRLKNDQHDLVLRIPKPETNVYINREQEEYNYNLAVELGLALKPFWRRKTGMSLTETLRCSRVLNQHDLKSGDILNQLMLKIYRLHSCAKPFQGEVNLADSLCQYFKLLPVDSRGKLRNYYEQALKKLSEIAGKQNYRVPSHNDLVLGNLLIVNQHKIWFIDWEYSAMASPYWDLATLCNAAGYSRVQSDGLLQRYNSLGAELGGEYLHNYRFALQMLSICWLKVFTMQDINVELHQLKQLDQ
ncbi:MAG: phosphotransferase family protein [Gammaproteobacteria bacterium]|nr:phosphotransferase family protein [Gammaproteobacteria bacterium]